MGFYVSPITEEEKVRIRERNKHVNVIKTLSILSLWIFPLGIISIILSNKHAKEDKEYYNLLKGWYCLSCITLSYSLDIIVAIFISIAICPIGQSSILMFLFVFWLVFLPTVLIIKFKKDYKPTKEDIQKGITNKTISKVEIDNVKCTNPCISKEELLILRVIAKNELYAHLDLIAQKNLESGLENAFVQKEMYNYLKFILDLSDIEYEIKTCLEALKEVQQLNVFYSELSHIIIAVNSCIAMQNKNSINLKLENGSKDELIKAFYTLDYYLTVLDKDKVKNIYYFRNNLVLKIKEKGVNLSHQTKTFVCSKCQKEIPVKYYYKNGMCAECFSKQNQIRENDIITVRENSIYFDSQAFFAWASKQASYGQYEKTAAIALNEQEPTIFFCEDGEKTVEYRLQTEGNEDFTGKYFLISVRIGLMGNPPAPTMQMDGFISDTSEDRKMQFSDIGYRMEGHYLKCGREVSENRYNMMRGQDLVAKGLKYPGYTTPSNIRLIGICPECGKSFAFHGYAFYMAQNDVAYSDDGLDCCQIQEYEIDKETWKYETEGKVFRYYNSFNCPNCGVPYIDYKNNKGMKEFGVSGCVLLGRKSY